MEREGHRFPPEHRHVLREAERRDRLTPEPILAAAGVRAGETVVDLGAGTGFWTELLATLVGDQGTVYAVDVEPVMLADLRDLVQQRGLSNVRVVQSTEMAVPLGDGIADLVLLALVLHEPPDPVEFLREVVRLLKPNGRVLVVDWQKWPTEQGPPVEHRLSEEEAQALLGAAGLAPQRIDVASPDIYVLLAPEFHTGDIELNAPTV